MTYESLRIAIAEHNNWGLGDDSDPFTSFDLLNIVTRAESIDVHNEDRASRVRVLLELDEVREEEKAVRQEIYRLESAGEDTRELNQQLVDLKRYENQIRTGVL